MLQFSCSVLSDSAIPWTATCQASLSFTISQSLLRLKRIKSAMPPSRLIDAFQASVIKLGSSWGCYSAHHRAFEGKGTSMPGRSQRRQSSQM